jgi:hypothetical protein
MKKTILIVIVFIVVSCGLRKNHKICDAYGSGKTYSNGKKR